MTERRQDLLAAIDVLEAQRALLGDGVVDMSLAALRAELASLETNAAQTPGPVQTLKQVSILFLDVVGSTTLTQRLDPEEVSAVMDGALLRGTAIVQSHRGKVLQYAGDNFLAVFGAEEAAEDDAERAVRCGLDLLALGRALGAEVQAAHGHAGFDVRVGVHTGGVLLGGGVDEDGTIRGLSVNVAARMEQTAPAGALRISHDTYRHVRDVFDVQPQEPLAVKGVDDPVQSYLVRRLKPRAFRVVTRGIEGVETKMIGRDAELALLQDAFRRVLQPGAGLQRVTIVAEAGMGKSRLLYEFDSWAQARTEASFVFRARATPQSLNQPYGLLRDLIAWHWQIHDSDSMDAARKKIEDGLMPLFINDLGQQEAQAYAHLLGQLIGLDFTASPHIRNILQDPKQIRNRAFHAAAQTLRRIHLLGGSPIVMQLDDLHWADDASLDFINYLEQVNRDLPMLLLVLTRPTLFERRAGSVRAAQAWSGQRVELHPLDKTASRLLINELLKKLPEIRAALRELVTDRADGNPYYMEELVKMLIDQRAIDASGEQWRLDAERLLGLKVPPTLTGVLQARLDSLPSLERHALQLASVIGLNFWDRALAHVEPQAAEQLPPLSQRDLVRPKEVQDEIREYAFGHQILHQVTYGTVLKRIKRQAHAKAAQWLAEHSGSRANSLLGAAAQHYELAGDTANAAEFYTRAAEQAARAYAHESALAQIDSALALAAENDPGLRWRLISSRERTLDLLGRREAQMRDIESLERLAEIMNDDLRRAEAAWRRCDIACHTDDWVMQERQARRALALAESVGTANSLAEEIALRAIQRLAIAIALQGDPAAGFALAQGSVSRAQALGHLALQARLAGATAICAQWKGDRVAFLWHNQQALALSRAAAERRGEAIDLGNVAMGLLGFGDHAQARRELNAALKLNQELSNREGEGITLGLLSGLALREGDNTAALDLAQQSLNILVAVGSRFQQAHMLWKLGNAELALGRLEAAGEAFEQCEALARELRCVIVLDGLAGRAQVALALGDTKAAGQIVQRLLAESNAGAGAAAEGPSCTLDVELTGAFNGEYADRIRLTIYQVWAAAGDPRAAGALRAAHTALQREADAITDSMLRQSFLQNIPENREIVARWAEGQATR